MWPEGRAPPPLPICVCHWGRKRSRGRTAAVCKSQVAYYLHIFRRRAHDSLPMVLHAPAPHSTEYFKVSFPAVAGTLWDGVVTPLESVDGATSPVDAVEQDHASLIGG